jgi:malate dehydrogenase
MAASILLDKKRLLPAAAYLDGEWGERGIFVGVPVILGPDGVERVIELELTPEERSAFAGSVAQVRALVEQVNKLLQR